MKSIRKLMQSRKQEQNKNKIALVPTLKMEMAQGLVLSEQHIVKFEWDHWFYDESLYKEMETQRSRFFQLMMLFKVISHATKLQKWVLIHLKDNPTPCKHPHLDDFIHKFSQFEELKDSALLMQRLATLEKTLHQNYSHNKTKLQQSKTGETIIYDFFIKNLQSFGEAPVLVLGWNMNLQTMKPYLQTVGFSHSLLKLLQYEPEEFMLSCLRSRSIPDIFTNYGFVEWNNIHMRSLQKIMTSILQDKKANLVSQGDPACFANRELIDSEGNRLKARIESGFKIPVMSYFKINEILSVEMCGVDQTDNPLNEERKQVINKVLYPYEDYVEFLKTHTSSWKEIKK